MNNKHIKRIVFSALVAAIYAGLTYLSAFFGLAYGEIQFRLSEALTVLPVFSPSAVLGLSVGCFIANIGSANPFDMIIGTFATALSGVLTYAFRKIKIGGIPFVSLLCPIIINGLLVGLELSVIFIGPSSPFWLVALSVALGEAVVVLGLGIPLYKALEKHKNSLADFI